MLKLYQCTIWKEGWRTLLVVIHGVAGGGNFSCSGVWGPQTSVLPNTGNTGLATGIVMSIPAESVVLRTPLLHVNGPWPVHLLPGEVDALCIILNRHVWKISSLDGRGWYSPWSLGPACGGSGQGRVGHQCHGTILLTEQSSSWLGKCKALLDSSLPTVGAEPPFWGLWLSDDSGTRCLSWTCIGWQCPL